MLVFYYLDLRFRRLFGVCSEIAIVEIVLNIFSMYVSAISFHFDRVLFSYLTDIYIVDSERRTFEVGFSVRERGVGATVIVT